MDVDVISEWKDAVLKMQSRKLMIETTFRVERTKRNVRVLKHLASRFPDAKVLAMKIVEDGQD